MDTATRARCNRIALFLCLIISAAILVSQRPAPAAQLMAIYGASAAEERAIDWSVRRYRTAGLDGMPDLEVFLHRSHDGCSGDGGLYHAGRIDLCTEDLTVSYQKKIALHEMAHAWIEANVDPEVLDRFMDIRGIATWNDRNFGWRDRGNEQTAEIITWGLGEGEIAPLLPEAIDAATLAMLYRLLTDREPITPAA